MLNVPAQSVKEAQREHLLIAASLALTAVATVCVSIGIWRSSLNLSDYGLIASYPAVFFAGLALLPLASSCLWFTRRRVAGIVLIQLLILIVALWLSPYLIESTARFRASYKNFGPVDVLLRGEGLSPHEVVYHNWPLFPITMAGVVKVTSVGPARLLGLFPVVMQVAYLFPLLALLRIPSRSDNRWWAGVWFFYIFNWTGQDYFSPQAFAFLLFLILVALLAYVASRRHGEFNGLLTMLTLTLYVMVVLTHFLTAAVILAVMTALTVGGLLRRWPLVLTCGMIFVAWQTYGAFPFFHDQSNRIVDSLVDPVDFFNLNLGNRLSGSPGHAVVGNLRMLMAALAFALVGTILAIDMLRARIRSVVMRRRLRQDRILLGLRTSLKAAAASIANAKVIFERGATHIPSQLAGLKPVGSFGSSVSFAVLLLLPLFVVAPIYAYGGEILIRTVLFSLPALAFLLVGATSSRFALLLVAAVLVPAAPLHIVTHYGNEAYDYVSPGELEGFDFVAGLLPPANVYGGYPAAAFRDVAQLEWRHAVVAGKDKLPSVDDYLHPERFGWEHRDWPIYVIVSRGDDNAARLFYDRHDFSEQVRRAIVRAGYFRPVFDNGDFAVYRWCGHDNDANGVLDCASSVHDEPSAAKGES